MILFFLIFIGCSNKDYQLELISSNVILTDTPIMKNSVTPEGKEPDVPEYFLEYTFVIHNIGSQVGNDNELIQLEFQPDEDLEKLLGKDTFARNPINGMQGPANLESDSEGEYQLVFGLDKEMVNKIDKVNMEELLQGTLIVKEGSRRILQFALTGK